MTDAITFNPDDFGIVEGQIWHDVESQQWIVYIIEAHKVKLIAYDDDLTSIRTKTLCPFILCYTHTKR